MPTRRKVRQATCGEVHSTGPTRTESMRGSRLRPCWVLRSSAQGSCDHYSRAATRWPLPLRRHRTPRAAACCTAPWRTASWPVAPRTRCRRTPGTVGGRLNARLKTPQRSRQGKRMMHSQDWRMRRHLKLQCMVHLDNLNGDTRRLGITRACRWRCNEQLFCSDDVKDVNTTLPRSPRCQGVDACSADQLA